MGEVKDGSTGQKAKVDTSERLWVRSVQKSEIQEATKSGDGFNIHTGLMEFTTAAQTESAILYFKNSEPRDFVISDFIITANSSGTVGDSIYTKFWRNPKLGTIVSDAVDVAAKSNRDTNSNKDLGASLAYSGGEGKTFTDGEFFGAIYCPNGQGRAAALNVSVGRGGSFGFTVDTDVTAGTLKLYAVIIGYYKDLSI